MQPWSLWSIAPGSSRRKDRICSVGTASRMSYFFGINPGNNGAVIQILYQRQASPVPLSILEIRHVRDVRHQSMQRFVGLKSSVEQIVRQILFAGSSRMRLGLAHLSDACTEIVSTHYTLQRRLTNADAEASLQQRTHSTATDRKEKISLNCGNFFNKIAVPVLFRVVFRDA